VSRLLITGMSGTGKSTVLIELARRGHRVQDTDYDGWVLPDGTWDEPRMWALLNSEDSVVVSGTVENQTHFYTAFRHVVLLSAPLPVLLERVQTRLNNPYGRTNEQQNEIRTYVRDVEPLLRARATVELDAQMSVTALADAIEALI
jgi:shikimate kinase